MSTRSSTKTAHRRINLIVLLAVLVGGTGLLMTPSQPASGSHLSEGIWANTVNACAIDEGSSSRYAFNNNRLHHRTDLVGTLIARCNVENLPISPPFGDVIGLELIYRDPDGPGTAYRVTAKLIRVTNTGAVATLASVDSNSTACLPASPSFQSCFAQFSHDFNFANNGYYVEVTVFRNDALQAPAAVIVRITGALT